MFFDPTFLNLLVGILVGLSGATIAVAGIAKFCLGYSWSDCSSRNFSKHNEK